MLCIYPNVLIIFANEILWFDHQGVSQSSLLNEALLCLLKPAVYFSKVRNHIYSHCDCFKTPINFCICVYVLLWFGFRFWMHLWTKKQTRLPRNGWQECSLQEQIIVMRWMRSKKSTITFMVRLWLKESKRRLKGTTEISCSHCSPNPIDFVLRKLLPRLLVIEDLSFPFYGFICF